MRTARSGGDGLTATLTAGSYTAPGNRVARDGTQGGLMPPRPPILPIEIRVSHFNDVHQIFPPLTTKSPATHVTISHTSQEIPQSPPVTKAERLHQPGCSPPLHATDHLGLGARTGRHDREPGGLSPSVGRWLFW